jgi:hypothetical protein
VAPPAPDPPPLSFSPRGAKPPRAPFHRFPPPRVNLAKCPLPGIGFRCPLSEIAEKPPPPHLFSELRCSPSPSQNGRTTSCSLSLSLWSPGTRSCFRWPQGGIIAVGNPSCRRCSATERVPRRPGLAGPHWPWAGIPPVGHLGHFGLAS